MLTDRTQIDHVPSFASELEALQPKIEKAIKEVEERGGPRVVTQRREAGED